ncbi:DUF4115 domain-containing protein [Aestuariibacter halophilus]|uniref:DUF4115 domain-containing protein n=1 Tax=Fluctibacter halophilus TaxID=226011 RepID=A0ABS8G510_9ALTE|nr:RodZ domain-containing protein [Aestuariibacter halophilus]MCC2614955.1 DUF4115 domain-containing protein [Aestuariibacter halophilus]
MSEDQQESVQEAPQGPGPQLKAARITAGLSEAEVADKLRLKVTSIVALENDQIDERISLTFTRGYLKLYARLVNLPESDVLETFDRFHTHSKEPAKLQSFSRRVAKQASDDRLMMVTYLIVALVIALVVVWWFQQSGSDDGDSTLLSEPASSSVSTAANRQADNPPATTRDSSADNRDNAAEQSEPDTQTQSTLEQVVITPTERNDEVPVSEEPQPATDTGASAQLSTQQAMTDDVSSEDINSEDTGSPTAVVSMPDAAPVELVFEFSGDCWMNLVDATGEAIAYGVKAKGRVMPVTGIPPFEVTLGAPGVVEISYNGEAVDMSQFDETRTARFNLPLGE